MTATERVLGPVPVPDYRTLMSAFPSGVAVVASLDRDGGPHGLTCNSLTSVTLSPPTLLVCLHVRSGTWAAVQAHGGFTVNLLRAKARHAAEVFSSGVPDRFAKVRWRPSRSIGLPWLYCDAFATAECLVAGTTAVGDHIVVLGEVVDVVQEPDIPLLYGMRQFSAWPPGQPSGGAP